MLNLLGDKCHEISHDWQIFLLIFNQVHTWIEHMCLCLMSLYLQYDLKKVVKRLSYIIFSIFLQGIYASILQLWVEEIEVKSCQSACEERWSREGSWSRFTFNFVVFWILELCPFGFRKMETIEFEILVMQPKRGGDLEF